MVAGYALARCENKRPFGICDLRVSRSELNRKMETVISRLIAGLRLRFGPKPDPN
jgi:hypothetical protein